MFGLFFSRSCSYFSCRRFCDSNRFSGNGFHFRCFGSSGLFGGRLFSWGFFDSLFSFGNGTGLAGDTCFGEGLFAFEILFAADAFDDLVKLLTHDVVLE
jgi:hypothetical protein